MSSSTTATSPRTPGTTRAATPSSRRSTTSSAAPRSSTAPRCTGCAKRTSASSRTTTAALPRGRWATTSSSPTTRRPSSSTRCTARAGRTRPSRTPARPTRTRPSATSRASSSSRTTWRRPGCTRSTRPAASCSTRPTRPTAAACAARRATASRAWCTRSQTPRCWRCARRSTHPNVTLLTRSRALRLETNATGTAVTGVVVERDGEQETLHGRHRRRLVRRRELGGAAAVLGERRAPARHRERVRPTGTQLHVPQQPGRAGAVEGREPDGLPEDARAQRLLLRRGRLRVPAGEHPDGRQVLRRHVPRREAAADEARAAVDAGPGRPPRGRLLALHGGPAATGEPRHAAPRREPPARLPADQPGAQGSGCSPSSSGC